LREISTILAHFAVVIGNVKMIPIKVQENNHRAQGIYQAAGFSQAVYVEAAGGALFLSKSLKNS